MDVVLDFIFGAASSPIEMAACFMLFICLLDAVFGFINTVMLGVIK